MRPAKGARVAPALDCTTRFQRTRWPWAAAIGRCPYCGNILHSLRTQHRPAARADPPAGPPARVTPRYHPPMVTQPRMPCYKLALRFDRDDMIKRFLTSQKSGFYFSVIEEGEVQAGSKVEIMSRDPQRVAVVDIVRLYLRRAHDPEILHRAMNVSALPQHWKAELAVRVDRA